MCMVSVVLICNTFTPQMKDKLHVVFTTVSFRQSLRMLQVLHISTNTDSYAMPALAFTNNDTVILLFTGPPTITTHPTSQLTNVSMSVTLDCEGTGRGSITYHWETSNINGGQWMNISNSNSRSLVVRNLEQSQQYRCVLSNEAGSTRSNVATVTVLSKLFINMIAFIIVC